MSGKLLYGVSEAAEQLGIGRTVLYEMVTRGVLHPVKIGRRTLFHKDELSRAAGQLARDAGAIMEPVGA